MSFSLTLREAGIRSPEGLTKSELLWLLSKMPPSSARTCAEAELQKVGDAWVASVKSLAALGYSDSRPNVQLATANRKVAEQNPRGANVGFVDPSSIMSLYVLHSNLERVIAKEASGIDVKDELANLRSSARTMSGAGLADLETRIQEMRRVNYEKQLMHYTSSAKNEAAHGRSFDAFIEKAREVSARAREHGVGWDVEGEIAEIKLYAKQIAAMTGRG